MSHYTSRRNAGGWQHARRKKAAASPYASLAPSVLAALEKQGKLPEGADAPSKTDVAKPKPPSRAVKTPSDYAKTLYGATLVVDTSDLPRSVTFTWEGGRVMTNNQLLHGTTYLSLRPFKKACHDLCRLAILTTPALRRFFFDSPVHINVHRTTKRGVDPDGIVAGFKFLIDGFVLAGLLRDDDCDHVLSVTGTQSRGDYAVTVEFRIDQAD